MCVLRMAYLYYQSMRADSKQNKRVCSLCLVSERLVDDDSSLHNANTKKRRSSHNPTLNIDNTLHTKKLSNNEAQILSEVVRAFYLVGVVSADVAERGGGRLAEQAGGVAGDPLHADVLGAGDVG